MKFLIDRFKIDLREHDSFDYTPIHYAAMGNHQETILSILSRDMRCQHARTSLTMRNNSNNNNSDSNNTNMLAIEMPNANENTVFAIRYPFHYAARVGAHDILKRYILDVGSENIINAPDCFPFLAQDIDGFVIQEDSTHDVDTNDESSNNNNAMNDDLYESPYGKQMSPLAHAVSVGDLKTAKLLINYGADINAIDGNQRTIIHHGSMHGHVDIVPWIIQEAYGNVDNGEGSEHISKQDLLGKTALHYASAIGSYQIVKVLVNSFTDHDKLVNFMKLQDNDGQTAYDIVSNGKIYDGAKLKELGVTNSKFKMMIGMIDSY